MKILILNKYFHPKIGGIETVVRQHAELLASNGHDIEVLVCNEVFDIPTSTYIEKGYKVTKTKTFFEKFSMPVSLDYFIQLFRKANKYDLIYIHEPFPAGLLGLCLMPWLWKHIVVYYHSDIVGKGVIGNFFTGMQRFLYKRFKQIMTSSPRLVKFSGVLKNLDKVTVIPIWVDDCSLEKHKNKSYFSTEDYFLYIGRNSYYKGINVLIEALYLYYENGGTKNVVLAGDDFSGYKIKNKSKRINIINSSVSDCEKNSLIYHSYALIFPSIAVSEAYGIVQVEALARGVPVINTELDSGVPWVSKNDLSGLTVQPNDALSLCQAMLKIEDSELRNRLSIGAKRRFSEILSEKNNVELFLANFEGRQI